MVKGFDCSHFNEIDFKKAKQYFDFVFIKAAQGISFHDPAFQAYWKAAIANGFIVGTYDFWDAQADPIKQADNFLNRGVDWSKQGILPPVIDIENQIGATPAISAQLDKYILANKEKCRDNALQLLEIVNTRTGRVPIVYCSPHFLQEYLGDSKPFSKYGLWIAGYQTTVPHLPDGFTNWLFWQNSEYGKLDGSLTGGDLDLDLYNGGLESLEKLANIHK